MGRFAALLTIGVLLSGCPGSLDQECQVGQVLCDGICVNLMADDDNCGMCGHPCADTERCEAGACAGACPPGLESCFGACVDTQYNPESCGGCGQRCASGQWCSRGTCTGGDCPSGLVECPGDGCVNLDSNPEHCGACGTACPGPCYQGECQSSCPAGFTDCDGFCADLDKDDDNCGECGRACAAGEECAHGRCVLNCPAGFENCAGECAYTETDPNHCGGCDNACGAAEVCNEGACTATGCSDGLTDCDGACVDTRYDPEHCGGCDNACGSGRACLDGSCGVVCPEGQTECDGTCVTTASDPSHCGACGTACRADQVCQSGACRCASGREECAGACVDTSVDPEHCGACGARCTGSEACVGGACTLDCPDGTTACDGGCVDTNANRMHCGACGHECAVDETCVDGVCSGGSAVPGDSCTSPIDVSGGGRFTGSTSGASADYAGSCGGTTGPDLVFRYTLTARSDVHLNTFGSSFDTILYVRSGDCTGETELGCDDDCRESWCVSDERQSTIQLLDQAPGTYYVILDGFGTSGGDYVLDVYISPATTLQGDTCGRPFFFDVSAIPAITGNTGGDSSSVGDDALPQCISSSGGRDYVHAFIVDSPMTVTFDTCSDTDWDTVLDLRRVCNERSASSTVICDDDDTGGCSPQSRVEATLEPGVYYLWLDGYRASEGGAYRISITR